MKKTKVSDQPKQSPVADVSALQQELEQLKQQLQFAQESERRAIADYHNLMRRTQDDRARMVKLAAQNVIESILQPYEHLFMAKEQLKDPGLNMVFQQFQQALKQEGLEEIEVMGQEFDPEMMEVIDKQIVDDPHQFDKVIKVTQRGYMLNGQVIQHPKVIIGVEG